MFFLILSPHLKLGAHRPDTAEHLCRNIVFFTVTFGGKLWLYKFGGKQQHTTHVNYITYTNEETFHVARIIKIGIDFHAAM